MDNLIFPSLANQTPAIYAESLSPDEAVRQAAFFQALLQDVICQQLLPSVTFGLFDFKLQFHSYLGCDTRPCMSAAIHASSPLPPFSSSNGQDFILVNIPGTADGSTRQELIAYVMLLQRLFDGSENTIANHMPDGLPATSPLSNTLRAYVSVNIKLKCFDSIPDLLADLAADGLDLTSIQPFLAV